MGPWIGLGTLRRVKRIVVLGSTGSIGRQTLGIVRQHPDRLEVVGLAAGSDANALREQAGGKGGNVKAAAKASQPKAADVPTFNFAGKKIKKDDMKVIEGIGPKIAELLADVGIDTWEKLSMTSPYRLREILEGGGPQYNIHDPETWPKQAGLAADGKWDELKTLQDELSGGKA